MSAIHAFPVGLVHVDPNDEVDAMIVRVGRARGFALNMGTLALICATAETEPERAEAAAEFRAIHDAFRDAMGEASRKGPLVADMKAMLPQRIVLQAFLDLAAPMADRIMELGRAEAVEVATMARRQVLPTIYEIISHIQERRDAALQDVLATMSDRGAMLETLMRDMGRIGRMIGIVSINASVEAARVGGDSGRTFQVIAAEIRSLSTQSASLLADLRARIADGATVRAPSPPPPGAEGQRPRSAPSIAASA